mmetsp:Transcript_82475/g.256123  ORF Transcript_82475/g.256123 Transcript_82475/m.256123 type:complete len:308 (+) Transcript_82475:780-1703(+)
MAGARAARAGCAVAVSHWPERCTRCASARSAKLCRPEPRSRPWHASETKESYSSAPFTGSMRSSVMTSSSGSSADVFCRRRLSGKGALPALVSFSAQACSRGHAVSRSPSIRISARRCACSSPCKACRSAYLLRASDSVSAADMLCRCCPVSKVGFSALVSLFTKACSRGRSVSRSPSRSPSRRVATRRSSCSSACVAASPITRRTKAVSCARAQGGWTCKAALAVFEASSPVSTPGICSRGWLSFEVDVSARASFSARACPRWRSVVKSPSCRILALRRSCSSPCKASSPCTRCSRAFFCACARRS